MSLATGAVAMVRANGAVRPRTVQNVPCPTGIGSMSVDLTTATAADANINANVGVTFNNCGVDGYTFAGSWVENFDFGLTFSQSSATLNGSVAVSSSTIQVNSANCLVNMADNFSNMGYNTQTGAYSGSVSYNGSACGVRSTGSLNP
jgi:hypothetical protein